MRLKSYYKMRIARNVRRDEANNLYNKNWIWISIIVIIVSIYGYLIKKKFDDYTLLCKREIFLWNDFRRKQTKAATLHLVKTRLQLLEKQLTKQLQSFSNQHNVPLLLQDVTSLGKNNNLVFKSFVPQPVLKHEFYQILPIKIVLLGQYQQITLFINQLLHLSQLVSINDFELSLVSSQEHEIKSISKLVIEKFAEYIPTHDTTMESEPQKPSISDVEQLKLTINAVLYMQIS